MDMLTIFISSAIDEFVNERKALKAALERWQFVRAWVFEEETAFSEELVPGYLRRVAESDIVVLLIGNVASDPVDKEFATALGTHRPILAFVKRSVQGRANALFAKYQASDKFKYALFDNAPQLEAFVVEAVEDEIIIGYRKWRTQAQQLVQTFPRLPQSERDELDRAYLAEVVRKYEFWRTHYTPLAAIARWRDDVETSRRLVSTTATPAEFMPRGFDVLLREKFPRERETDEIRSRRESEKTEHYDDLRDAVEKHGDLILLGDPGAGKTTTLWRLMYDYASRTNHPLSPSPTHPRDQPKLPILISLGRYDGTSPILDFLRAELVLQSKADSSGNAYPTHRKLAAHLDEYLDDGRLMLLFDALNEMPQAHYADSMRRLEQFRDAQRGNRFLFTCRALDYTTKLDLPEATIQDLDEDAQRNFLTAYFSDAGARLFETLRDSHKDLLDIGHNPYMLLMIGQVYQLQGELPSNRGLLFQSFVNALMERERKTHSDRWLGAEIQLRVLSDLAFAIQHEHGRGTSVLREWADKYLTGRARVNGRGVAYNPADLLYLARSASLLDESADGSLRFTHQLLQEYFAAVALSHYGMQSEEMLQAAKNRHWDNVLVLLAGIIDQVDCLIEVVSPLNPYLAARLVQGSRGVSMTVRHSLVQRLELKLTSKFRGERLLAIRALADMKAKEAVPQLVSLLSSESPKVRQAVVEALKSIPEAAPYTLQHEGWSAYDVLREMPAEAAPHLLPLLRDGDPITRMVTAWALEVIATEKHLPLLAPLLSDNDAEVSNAAFRIIEAVKRRLNLPKDWKPPADR